MTTDAGRRPGRSGPAVWLCAALLLACCPRGWAADDLTVISFGRADQDAMKSAFFADFRRTTGIGIKSLSYDGAIDELEQMARSGAISWDLMQVESRTLQQGCARGLFEKIDFTRIGKRDDFIPGAVSDCGVGIFAWSVTLVYDDRLKPGPRSWTDFWDVQRFPGKRGLRRSAKYTLEIALLADGVAPGDVYPMLATERGVTRALRKLEQLRPYVVWWQAAPQPAALLASGVLTMSSAYALWFDPQEERNQHIAIAWQQSLYDIDSWAIPKGTPKRETAYRFIAFASRPEQQKALSERVFYGPANIKTFTSPPPTVPDLTNALKVDTQFWIDHGDALEKRFDAWAPPMCRQQTDDDEDDHLETPGCQDPSGYVHAAPDRGTGTADKARGIAN